MTMNHLTVPTTPPPAEHVSTLHNAVTLNPAIPTSFVAAGVGHDGAAPAYLGAGPSDGFEKTVIYQGGLAGCAVYLVGTVASGKVQLPDSGGSAVLRWNASTAQWFVTAVYSYSVT